MCTVCIAMFRKGITDLCGLIYKNNEEVLKDTKARAALSLEPYPTLSISVLDTRLCERLYEEHVPIRYCPFCGQKLR